MVLEYTSVCSRLFWPHPTGESFLAWLPKGSMCEITRSLQLVQSYPGPQMGYTKKSKKGLKKVIRNHQIHDLALFNGHSRIRLIGGTDSIYKAYCSGLCKGISPENMALYGTVPPF